MVTKPKAKETMHGAVQIRGPVYSAGFTMIELWVVITVLTVLSAILLPALSQSRLNSKSFQCLENTRRLTLAWQLYAGDNRDRIVYACDDGSGNPYVASMSGAHANNNYAWTWSKMNFVATDPYNWDTNADFTLRPLWQYVKDSTVYRCPADPSQITIGSLPSGYAGPYTVGSIVPRIRSYSMNFYLGGFGANPTLSGGAGVWATHFPFYLKMSEIGNLAIAPGPNQTFVFIDERCDCINWGSFVTDFSGYPIVTDAKPVGAQYQWNEDLPASYHGLAANVSFADGHAEPHRWRVSTTYPPLMPEQLTGGKGSGNIFPAPFSQDVAWMQNVSARPH